MAKRHVIPSHTQALLPTAGTAGALAWVTNGVTGVWTDTGSQWVPLSSNVVDARWFGVKADGVTDDQAALALAVAQVSSGGILLLPVGTILTTSANALLSMTDKNGVTVQGAGIGLTILKQAGTGHVIELLSSGTSVGNMRIVDLSINGNSTAAKGIDTFGLQDSVIERVNISGCKNHGIDFRGLQNLHNVVRDCRITSPSGITSGARGINCVVGNTNSFERIYFNNGGNDANHYQVALDVSASGGHRSYGCTYDGVPTAIKTNGPFVSIGDWFDFSSGAGVKITYAFEISGSNHVMIITPSGTPASPSAWFTFSGAGTLASVSLIGSGSGNISIINGQAVGAAFSPSQITSDQNNYSPTDANGISALYYSTWRVSTDNETRALTGIVAGVDGQQLVLVNVGSFAITLRHQNSSSTAANRIITPDGLDTVIRATDQLRLIYDGTTARWRVITPSPVYPDIREPLTPAQITAAQNDYAPSSMAGTHIWRLSTDAARNITGISINNFMFSVQSAIEGYRVTLVNVGAFNIVLTNQDAASAAGNRIITGTGANLTLTPDQSATLLYDTTTSRWRVVSKN